MISFPIKQNKHLGLLQLPTVERIYRRRRLLLLRINDRTPSPPAYSRFFRRMEPMDIVGKLKEDVSLPKATMFKIIKEMLPPDVRVARDAQDLLVECCVEYINLISSEANEVCNREEKRTIAPEHVIKALEVLGFGQYIEEVYSAYEQHRLETQDAPKPKWPTAVKMTEEEALAEQQRMFAEARARMNGGVNIPKKSDSDQA